MSNSQYTPSPASKASGRSLTGRGNDSVLAAQKDGV